eukprot:1482678-Pleurochrysis_carterae.AAC.2
MWEVARDECTARVRGESVTRRATCHSKRPPRRMNGSSVRFPAASGGNSRARVLAKWQSVPSTDHNCPTDKSESRMDGTHLTPVRVKLITRLRESRTESGKSPMATHGRGLPSTPDTDSVQGFRFIRSCK